MLAKHTQCVCSSPSPPPQPSTQPLPSPPPTGLDPAPFKPHASERPKEARKAVGLVSEGEGEGEHLDRSNPHEGRNSRSPSSGALQSKMWAQTEKQMWKRVDVFTQETHMFDI